MIKEFLKFAIVSIRHRKLRSWLTIIGIVIGVAAVVSLISIGQGMQSAISEQFERLGTDKLIVMPGGGFMESMTSTGLTKDDLDVIKRTSGVDLAAEMLYQSIKIKYSSETKTGLVIGLPTDDTAKIIEDMQGFEPEKGRILSKNAMYEANVGYVVWSNDFFKKPVNLRNKLEIGGKDFQVVGLMKKIGNRMDDSQIYIPIETAREVFNESTGISAIYLQVKSGYNVSTVAENIKRELRKSRDEKKGEETFQVQTTEQLMASFNTIFGIIQAILVGIASIALLVGGVGIMNTMYTSVIERTRQIGVMKATGAKNSHVLLIFLIESGLLGLIGGIIGVIMGLGMAKGAEYYAQFAGYSMVKAAITPTLIAGGLLFSFGLGAIAGILPARQASKLKPADALRYE